MNKEIFAIRFECCAQVLGAGRYSGDPEGEQRAAPLRQPAGVRLRARRGAARGALRARAGAGQRAILRLGPDLCILGSEITDIC